MLLVVSFCIALGSCVDSFSASAGVLKQHHFVELSPLSKRGSNAIHFVCVLELSL